MTLSKTPNPAPATGPDFTGTLWDAARTAHMQTATATFDTLLPAMRAWVARAEDIVNRQGKILLFGNGGSAADAQHIAAELSVRLKETRDPIAALALATDPSSMTACANDLGFDQVFARQVHALGRADDMAVGITTSGTSPNVIKALAIARAMGMATIALTGGAPGTPVYGVCDIVLPVPSLDTARIQEMHITLGHVFCGALEKQLGLL